MRVKTIFLLLLLADLAATPAVPQKAAGTGVRHPVITDISVADHADSVAVEITFSEVVKAEVSRLEHPDRLVFDFPGCDLARPGQRLAVNSGTIAAVRAAEFSVAPPLARVVIDLNSSQLQSAQDHQETYAGNKLVIKLSTGGAARSPIQASLGDNHIGAAVAAPNHSAYSLLAKARDLSIADLEPLEAKARADDPESETTLALAYHAGTLLKMDDAEALHLLQQAANHGFVAAEEAMGIFCQSGFGMPPDKAQAFSWYTKAAEHGSRDAATNLALMYTAGDGVNKDAAKAASWFRKAAEAGDATAQLNLAALYHRGEGVPQDDKQTVVWLTKSAEQGLIPALLELGRWDLRPENGRNVDAAIGWFKKAAEQGDAAAESELGDIFIDIELGRVDYSQAANWYRKAAEQGQPEAEFGLGTRYMLGQGVPRDLVEARRWLTPAADRGHPYAQLVLATMFEGGLGGTADAVSAAKYYELAANQGVDQAQYRLGLLLASDRTNATNLVAAYKWLVLAQDSVPKSAAKAQEIRKALTAPQIAEAEHAIDEWRSAHRSPSAR